MQTVIIFQPEFSSSLSCFDSTLDYCTAFAGYTLTLSTCTKPSDKRTTGMATARSVRGAGRRGRGRRRGVGGGGGGWGEQRRKAVTVTRKVDEQRADR